MIPPEKLNYFAFTIYTMPKKKTKESTTANNNKALLCTKEAMLHFGNNHTNIKLYSFNNFAQICLVLYDKFQLLRKGNYFFSFVRK
jgi:hypothetical protein